MSEKVAKHVPENEESKLPLKESGENGFGDSKNTSKKAHSNAENETVNEKEIKETVNSERPMRKYKRIRSRSKTPQIKNGIEKAEIDTKLQKPEIENEEEKDGSKETKDKSSDNIEKDVITQQEENKNADGMEIEEADDTKSFQDAKPDEDFNTTDELVLDSESYMDPLVLQSDEPCPELEFEENSDKESGKYSPIISRCVTRRSQNRNIPTPKTPKSLIDEQESEKGITPVPTPDPEEVPKNAVSKDLNETDNSSNTDNLSTKVQVGGDATRTDFSEGESDFLFNLKNKETTAYPRSISSRKSIRSSDDIRKRSFKNSMHRVNLSIPFFSSDSIERAPSVKRKSRSETPEDGKRFKEDSPGFMAKITSPLNSLRSKFAPVPTSTSTPKLTSYRDLNNHFGGDFFDQMELPGGNVDPQSKWCSIM